MQNISPMAKTSALIFAMIAGAAIKPIPASAENLQTVTIAGGCFWCVESDFESVDGVVEAISGYTGGSVANPTYRQVSGKRTGHHEAVEVTYDADIVSRDSLYHAFFRSIDPLNPDGQFCDYGAPYKTAIFVDDAADQSAAERAKQDAEQDLGQQIVTEILPAAPFYPAEEYHQNYYKSDTRVGITSVGIAITRAQAYERYRDRCGRDARVLELWGDAAPFAKNH